jgi:hypothetical protein
MRKIAVAGAVLAGLIGAAGAVAPAALAQEVPTDCAAAVVALNDATAAHRAAVAADEEAADARAADLALEDAAENLADAKERQTLAAADVVARQQDTDEEVPGTPEHDAALAALADAEEILADRTEDVEDAQEAFDAAEDDAETNAGALQAEADKTNAAVLEGLVDDARDDFNRLCTEGDDDADVTTTPATPTPAPVTVVPDVDVDVDVDVPSGGVDTGGGPA